LKNAKKIIFEQKKFFGQNFIFLAHSGEWNLAKFILVMSFSTILGQNYSKFS
jgi:hypothetical protein